jgi:hypothetical protein
MALDPITAVLGIGEKLIGHFFPDAAQADAAKLKLLELQQTGELAEITGQLEINKIEAASSSTFVAGWRPFVGWVCGVSLGLAYIPKALFLSCFWAYQAYTTIKGGASVLPVFPDLGVTDLLGLLGAMLGIGGMRSLEKVYGVETKSTKRQSG